MHRRSDREINCLPVMARRGPAGAGKPRLRGADRELQALGHTVRLMPPSYVKAYLKRGKNDANDAGGDL